MRFYGVKLMGNLDNFKIGAIEGVSALLILIAIIIAAIAVLAVIIICSIKAVKERKDAEEDRAEDEFFAEYGVTGEELRLNQQLTDMRSQLISQKRLKKQMLDEQHIVVVRESVEKPVEVVKEVVKEVPVEVIKEVPVEVVKEVEVIKEVPVEVVKEVPVEQPAPQPVEQGPVPVKPEELVPVKKEENWKNYDGEYEGVYYDPEDGCYYEGTPSPELAKRLEEYQAELAAKSKRKKKEVIVKKVTPPFLALKTPKNERKAPKKEEGFDLSVIYGKYVIEHVAKEDGKEEYFYTLYGPKDNVLYESSNYSALPYCKRAITRFQTHVLVGEYSIDVQDGKYFFVLRRKTYVHKGLECATFDEANSLINQVKSYAQTDIIREQ